MDDICFISIGKGIVYLGVTLVFTVLLVWLVYGLNTLMLAIFNVKKNMELLWKFRQWQKKQETT